MLINLVPMLVEQGMSRNLAAVALGLGGVGQVIGRLGYARFAAATSVRVRTVAVIAAIASPRPPRWPPAPPRTVQLSAHWGHEQPRRERPLMASEHRPWSRFTRSWNVHG